MAVIQSTWQQVRKGKHGTVEQMNTPSKTVYRVVWKKQVDHRPQFTYVGLGMTKGQACDFALRLAEEGFPE